jgi:Rps23 Pro-64 3,4-dihydroxylase Tpa1-like proline 4-hydroxylase
MVSISETASENRDTTTTGYSDSVSSPECLDATGELFSDAYSKKLESLGEQNAEKYRNNKPFPHIYFDDFLPLSAAEAAIRDFPEPKQLAWAEFDRPKERKLAFDEVERLPRSVRDVLYFLNSRPMIRFLEVLTGIDGVVPDPYYLGGGLHQIKRGGNLEVHVDFNRHKKLKLDRRINLLIYLNKDWKEEYGGHFELWNRDMSAAEQKILPIFNRCAIFSTTEFSYHGHPTPLSCPPDRTRKSMATYYYTNGRPDEEITGEHSTMFKARPGQVAEKEHSSISMKDIVKAITPPILISAAKKLRR